MRVQPLHNAVHSLRDPVTRQSEHQQAACNGDEPVQIALEFLARDPHVHTPQTGDDIHGKDDLSPEVSRCFGEQWTWQVRNIKTYRAEDGELAQHVRRLLLPLVHEDVNVRQVRGVRVAEDPSWGRRQ